MAEQDNRESRKYSHGKIYAIRSKQTEHFYIGATTSSLTKRLSQQKTNFRKGSLASTSQHILMYEDAYIELMELCPCDNIEQLNKRMGELIRANLPRCVNIRNERLTQKEEEDVEEAIEAELTNPIVPLVITETLKRERQVKVLLKERRKIEERFYQDSLRLKEIHNELVTLGFGEKIELAEVSAPPVTTQSAINGMFATRHELLTSCGPISNHN